ncbi:MAG TPA: DUF4012 domain-containing protein [Patescibacteria group bacterium]|nr:DUF4012 domain-containing protein [Patescibacteria group bacterium]
MNTDSKLRVILFSDPNFLAINILETLLSKNCLVSVVSDDLNKWQERTKQIATNSRFSFVKISEYKNLDNFSYAIFCGGFLNKESITEDFKKFITNKNFGTAKTLAIFPFETFSLKISSKIAISDNAGIIYLGDLMGPRIDLNSNLLLPTLISEMLTKRTVTLPVGEIFYPVFITDAAKTIVKWLLSFGPYGRDTFLLGRQFSSSDFWKQNLKSFPDLKVLYDTKLETRFIPKGYDIHFINSNLNICLNETYRWLIGTKTVQQKEKVKKPRKYKFLRPVITSILFILFLPFITSLISGTFLYFSYKQFLLEKISNAQNLVLSAKTSFVVGKAVSGVLGNIPLLGRVYKETSYVSEAGEILTDMSLAIIPTAEDSRQILGNVLGGGIFDLKEPVSRIKLNLDYIYQELSFFEILTKNSVESGILSAKQVQELVDFDKFKDLSHEGGVIANNLPSILGTEENKNYLILFENNMELRPTGGFIGSYGVINFGGGKMNGLTVNDIYSADGQLKGHIEPPAPIKNYLNEANWWFRDSNWDPDFPTSSERAEWFLNKEMDQKVDGVIAIDLSPIKTILNYTGPIFLPDYNLTITPDNLYEKTQEEAQANSFPGSRQKASFLTALSRTLIDQIVKMNPKDRVLVLKAFYESLEGRHMQVYLHDNNVSSALNKLGWDGKIQSYSCGDECYSDFVGDVEANVGVNKSNYFVKRHLNFNVSFDPQKITRQMTIALSNSANSALGVSGIYKSYIRIMIPTDSKLISVNSQAGTTQISLKPEITQEKGRQEVGVLVETTPGQSKNIEFVWQNDLPQNQVNSYGLFVRKQAGVEADPLSIQVTGIGQIESRPVFSLTGNSVYTYNTLLSQDFFARLSWNH